MKVGSEEEGAVTRIAQQQNQLQSNLQDIRKDINQTSLFQENYFNSEHPKSIMVREFLKKLGQQKARFQDKVKKAKQMEVASLQKQLQKAKEENLRAKVNKHERLMAYRQRKKLEKQQQMIQDRLKKAEYRQFLRQQPAQRLYKQKQKQFIEEQVAPELLRKQLKMERIRSLNRPLDIQALQFHEQEYMRAKQQKQAQRYEDLKLQQNFLSQNQPQHYKGRFRYLVLQDILQQKLKQQEDVLEEDRIKKARRAMYSEWIRKQLQVKPKPKQKDSVPFRIRQRDLSKSIDHDPRKDGLNNLNDLHAYIAKIKPKSNSVKSNSNTIQTSTPSTSPKRHDYLRDLQREKKNQQLHSPKARSERIAREVVRNNIYLDYEKAKSQLEAMDKQAEMKHRQIRNIDKNPFQKLRDKEVLDDQYIQSIKAKIHLLSS